MEVARQSVVVTENSLQLRKSPPFVLNRGGFANVLSRPLAADLPATGRVLLSPFSR